MVAFIKCRLENAWSELFFKPPHQHPLMPCQAEDGGAEGVRTPDLLNAIQALYQLSYDPIQNDANLRP